MLSPKVRRWSVLFLVSVVMMTGYISLPCIYYINGAGR